ncbi:MAG: 50S ribosomal protein L24 [Ruminococcaceae bacterium]|nr:50S ribosomal protein L24 [Oscillospiraceae bacterium]
MNKLHIRKDDSVIVISGNEKGKKGKVIEVSPEEGKVIISGVNICKKHAKPRRQGEAGGILDVEGAIRASKVQLFCSKCNKGVRSAYKFENGEKIRVCAKCGAKI